MTRAGGNPRTRIGLGVQVTYDPGQDSVQIELTGLAARRLMLALGMHTKRYGPEVAGLLAVLTRLLIGVDSTAIETHHPHGRACPCPHCREVFRRGREVVP